MILHCFNMHSPYSIICIYEQDWIMSKIIRFICITYWQQMIYAFKFEIWKLLCSVKSKIKIMYVHEMSEHVEFRWTILITHFNRLSLIYYIIRIIYSRLMYYELVIGKSQTKLHNFKGEIQIFFDSSLFSWHHWSLPYWNANSM